MKTWNKYNIILFSYIFISIHQNLIPTQNCSLGHHWTLQNDKAVQWQFIQPACWGLFHICQVLILRQSQRWTDPVDEKGISQENLWLSLQISAGFGNYVYAHMTYDLCIFFWNIVQQEKLFSAFKHVQNEGSQMEIASTVCHFTATVVPHMKTFCEHL